MKNSNKISSIFTAFLAVLILFVSGLSSSINNTVSHKKQPLSTEKQSKKANQNNQVYFNKTSIEAVYSQIIPSFECDAVEFLAPVFKFTQKEIFSNYKTYFERISFLEILFEHLSAPNAP